MPKFRRAVPVGEGHLGWCLLELPTSYIAFSKSFNVTVDTGPRKITSCTCLHGYYSSVTCMCQVEHFLPGLCENDHSGAFDETVFLHRKLCSEFAIP